MSAIMENATEALPASDCPRLNPAAITFWSPLRNASKVPTCAPAGETRVKTGGASTHYALDVSRDGPEGHERVARFTPALPGLHRPFVVVDGTRRLLSLERFTALIDPRESDLQRIAEDHIDDVVPKGAVVRRGFDDEPGTPLWPWLLLAAVVLILGEGLVLRRSGSA